MTQLRLICNLIPSNAHFRVARGEVDELPYILQLTWICLLEDEILLISQEDMSCAFYLFRLPFEWARYFAVGQRIKFSDLEGNRKQPKSQPNWPEVSVHQVTATCALSCSPWDGRQQ